MLERFPTRAQKLVFTALLALFAAAIAVAIASTATLVGRTSPGFVVWRNLVVPSIGADDWPGMQAGVPMRTVLRTVDDAPVTGAAELRRRIGAPAGGNERSATRSAAAARRASSRSRRRAGDGATCCRCTCPTCSRAWCCCATALLIYVVRPADVAARAGAMLSGTAGLMLVLALDLFSAGWVQRIYFLAESLVPAALFDFGMSFPDERRFVRARPWLRPLLYATFVLLAVAQNVLLDVDPETHLLANDLVYGLAALAGLFAVVSLVLTLLRSRNPLARQQVQVVLAGMVLAALVPALGLMAILALGATIPMNALTPFLLLFPLSIGYAVARHDLFSVDRYLRLGVSYAALTVVVFGSYAGFVRARRAVARPPHAVGGRAALRAVDDAVPEPAARAHPACGGPALLPAALRLPRHGRVDEPARSRRYLESSRIAETVLATLVDDVAVDWALLVLLEDGRRRHRPTAARRTRPARLLALLADEPGLLERIARLPRPVRRLEHVDRLGRRARSPARVRFAERAGASLLLPLRFEGKPLGVLLVGEKLSGALFSDEDMQLLHTLAHQAALALTNARAYEIIRRTQDELVQAERLAAVGEMAAAVAHGIRNPVAGIRLFAELARDDLEDRPQIASTMTDIIAESDRLEKRVRSMLDLARPLEVKVRARRSRRPSCAGSWTSCARARRAASRSSSRSTTAPRPCSHACCSTRRALGECVETVAVNAFEALDGTGPRVAPRVARPASRTAARRRW